MSARLHLVTGGLGFLGGWVVRQLVESGERVRVLDAAEAAPARLARLRLGEADVVTASVLERDVVRSALAGVDVVHHVAGLAQLWDRDPSAYERVNVGGTEVVLDASLAAGVGTFVHTSTELLHRAWAADGAPASARDVPGPYLRSKLRAEERVATACARGLNAILLCPAAPLGPGDVNSTPPARMLRDFLSGRHRAYLEGTLQVVDVRDVAEAFEAASRLEPASGGVRRFVLAPHSVEFGALLAELEQLTGRRLARGRVPYPVAAVAAKVGEVLADHVTHREPPATRAGVRSLRVAPVREGLSTLADLGVRPRSLRRTLIDTLESMGEAVIGPRDV